MLTVDLRVTVLLFGTVVIKSSTCFSFFLGHEIVVKLQTHGLVNFCLSVMEATATAVLLRSLWH